MSRIVMSRIVPFSFAVFAVSSLCLAANQVVHVKKSGAERVVVTLGISDIPSLSAASWSSPSKRPRMGPPPRRSTRPCAAISA